MTTKRLPVGIENFEEIRKEDYYYVDKTGFITDMVKAGGKVNLFTRPRRFGKTLNMSMLRYFFEIGGDKSIFDGLRVCQDKATCEKYMGKYPVVFVSLKGVAGLTFANAKYRLTEIIGNEAGKFEFLMQSVALTEKEKARYQSITAMQNGLYTMDDDLLASSLQILCALLEKHYGQKTILLIDEYDVPLDKAYANGYYTQMLDLIRIMFSTALKTNDSLSMAVLTGCLRVSKESIFTGLNNLMVHSISDESFDEYFGFTDAEVRKMLVDYGLESHYTETKEWYDGYRFGGQDIYCPWDVINYCYALRASAHAQPKAYWINTSGNDMVRRLILHAKNGTTRREIEELIVGNTVTKALNENLTHNEVDKNIENIWSLLYMTGYLTANDYPDGNRYTLRIPNQEVRQIFMDQVLDWFRDKARAEADQLSDLYAAFEHGDTETIMTYLNKQLASTVSYYDARESFYHGFLLALLSACAQWEVSSNDEAGNGRADIIVEREGGELGFVIEIKYVKNPKMLDAACEAAIKQIEERDYTANLRRCMVEKILCYGIAFCDKRCRVMGKEIVSKV